MDFLKANLNSIINCAGILVLFFMVCNLIQLVTQKNYIMHVVKRKSSKSYINKNTRALETVEEVDAITPDDVTNYETQFNKVVLWHDAFARLISIFPLAGILGTVIGLIGLLEGLEGELPYQELALALNSTFFGLLWSIFLKGFDGLFPARIIEEAEILLEDYEKKTSIAYMQKNFME